MTYLSEDAVTALCGQCLFEEGADTSGAIIVEAVKLRFGFDPKKVEIAKPLIASLLAQLPDQFMRSKGGGWSFLNICEDRQGCLWTGFHSVQDALCALGIASGQAAWLMPRDMWEVLPGGVPYFVVYDDNREARLSEILS